METFTIDGYDKKISRVGLGTWAIGGWMWGGTDEKQSVKTIHTGLDKGITLLDTAPIYGFGKSEEIVGKAVKEYGNRDRVVLATKCGLEWDDDENVERNSSKDRIFKEVDDSLRRLGVDYIDIYQVHWPDESTPYEMTAQAMGELQEQGKIRLIGVSNYDPSQLDAFRRNADLKFNQPPYNLFEREIEQDVKPHCETWDINLMTYGALCRGLLSGKMSKDREFKGDDLRKSDPKFQEPRFSQYLNAVKKLDEFVQEKYNKRVIHLAVRWILDQGVQVALWGARRPDQLDPVDEIDGWSLTDEDTQKIDAIIRENIDDPVGPEFMAPPSKEEAAK